MIDPVFIRSCLARYRRELARLDEAQRLLSDMIDATERYLAVADATTESPTATAGESATTARPRVLPWKGARPRTGPALGDAIRDVLENADGRALSLEEIRDRVESLGAASRAYSPLDSIRNTACLLIKQGRPIERVGTRAFRWRGGAGSGRAAGE